MFFLIAGLLKLLAELTDDEGDTGDDDDDDDVLSSVTEARRVVRS